MIREKKVSAVEAVQAYIARITAVNPKLNAVVQTCFDRALKEAKEAESIVTHRQTHGRFDGFDALTKVPGIDREKLEKSRDAISF
jgi:amidase